MFASEGLVHDVGRDYTTRQLRQAQVAPVRLVEIGDPDALLGAAVFLVDNHVLRNIDEASRQIARVRRTDSRIGQTLAGAVCREEVLENRKAIAERRANRQLNDATRRIGHQAAHTGHLRDLLNIALRS